MSTTSPPPTPPRRSRRRTAVIAGIAVVGVVAIAAAVTLVATVDRSPRTTPDTASLAGSLADQKVEWEECEFQEEIPNAAPPEGIDISNLECATITVPKNWLASSPDETWEVRISQAKNIDVDDPDYNTTVISHPGGPVTPGLSYSALVQSFLPELRETTNFVSFDQRGLGQSSHAECEYEYVHDPADEDAAVRAIAEACSQDADVATMTTEQAVYDMDFVRHLLGLEKVTFYGASYGTWIGSWFGTVFDANIERMVLDSAVDFTQPSIQANYEAAFGARDRQFRLHLMNYIARHDATLGLGSDPGVIWERYFAATASPEVSMAAVLAWTTTGLNAAFASSLGYELAGGLVASIITSGESADPSSSTIAIAEEMINGVPDLPDELRVGALSSLETTLALYSPVPAEPGEVVQGSFDSLIEFTKCTDGEWTQGADYWQGFNDRAAAEAPFSEQLLLVQTPFCAFWPSGVTLPTPGMNFPETIVLQTELDTQTPFEQGRAAGLTLPNTSLIAIDNENAHGIFPYGTDQVDLPVIEFLKGGERPAPITIAAGKPIRSETTTFESWSPLWDDAIHRTDTPRFTDPLREAETPEVNEKPVDAPPPTTGQ